MAPRYHKITAVLSLVLALAANAVAQGDGSKVTAKPFVTDRPWESIDLVIALDTSDSMKSLIDAARLSLWGVVNELMVAEPQPFLRVALLTYGNTSNPREQGWVRIETDLTENLDLVSERLFALTTSGGSEYVARALQTAVEELSWTDSYDALKLVFVAGNEPADQDPEVDYRDAGRLAVDEGISVNVIFCGSAEAEQAETWKELADRAEGQFAAINHRVDKAAGLTTHYDKELADLSEAINKTYIPFGEAGQERRENLVKQDQNAAKLSPAAAAARARTKANPRFSSDWDLVSMIESGETSIYDVDEQDLPEELRRMTLEDRELYIEDLLKRREELRRQIAELSTKRRVDVAAQVRAKGLDTSRSFDTVVREAIRSQAADKGFELPEE
jgi:Mg-chelatase subunit ChlD